MHRSAILSLAVLLLTTGCNKVVMESHLMGSIYLALATDVEVDAVTKADTQDCSDFHVNITGETFSGGKWTKDYVYGSMPESVTVPCGTYTVLAENCTETSAQTENNGFGCVRYYGKSQPVEVGSTVPAPVSITCRMVNGKATLIFDESFLEDFTDVKATLSCDGRDVIFNVAEADDIYFNVDPEGSGLVYTINATVAAGTESERRVKYSNEASPLELLPAKWLKITLKSNHNGIIGPEISVDDSMGTNPLPEIIDPNGGIQTPDNGEMALPSITADVDIEEATVIDCYLNVH